VSALRKARVGISACLLGRKVRFDGRDKLAPALLEAMGPFVRWIPVCPEVELGLGVPREPIQLAGRSASPRLVVVASGDDLTAAMRRWTEARLAELSALELDGWVTKAGSPSCGLRGVPVHAARGGLPVRRGVGFFVRALRRRWPDLPIEEEGRLADPVARRRFLARVLAHQRGRRTPPPRRRGG
jgi:uncharacterized protein YbbK (DUF523 family)